MNEFDNNGFLIKYISVLRFFNKVVAIVLIFATTNGLEVMIELPIYIFLLSFFFSPLLFLATFSYYLSRHEFFEWDREERVKKYDFIVNLVLVLSPLSFLSMLFLFGSIYHLFHSEFDLFSFFFSLIIEAFLLLNTIFTIPLHYNYFYKRVLKLSNNVLPKPDFW